MSVRVLLIDDDARLFELLRGFLEPNDVSLEHAPGGAEGLAALRDSVYDAVFLDVMMPGLDGLQTLRQLRERSRVPVIMLTARGDEADRVTGLEMGADDYVAKPFSPRELLARLRAVLRRLRPDSVDETVVAGGLEISVGARTVQCGGRTLSLTGLEFDLLLALVRRAGRVVPRHSLLAEAGRDDAVVGERTVDVHISKLRKKLGEASGGRRLIRTVRGVGYVFASEETA